MHLIRLELIEIKRIYNLRAQNIMIIITIIIKYSKLVIKNK